MQKQAIRIVAKVIAHADKAAGVQATLQQIAIPTRQETSCPSYHP